MGKYRFGIVGAGLIADFHAAAIGELKRASLGGCYDAVPERAEKFAQKHGCRVFSTLEEMAHSPGIDILTVATPSGAHMEPVLAAAEGGKHAICEKPLEVTLERVDAMIKAHEKAGTQLGGIFQNRFTDAQAPLREAIRSGRFGTITYAGVYVPWWRSEEYYANSWHGTWKLDGGGALMNQSCHMVDMLCDLMPPAEAVMAYAEKAGHPGIETEDTATAVLRFAGGALGLVYGSSASYPGQLKRFEISGTRGTVVYLEDSFSVWQFADERPEDGRIRQRFGRVSGPGSVADPGNLRHENHARNFSAFLDALDSGTDFVLNGREARKAVALILAIYESARTHAEVPLK